MCKEVVEDDREKEDNWGSVSACIWLGWQVMGTGQKWGKQLK